MITASEKPDYKKAKAEAHHLLDRFNITAPPVNPVDIARHLGVDVLFVEFDEIDQNISGFFDCSENAIYVNKSEWPLRQTFTVAHELGHKILHEEWANSSDYKMLFRDQDADGDFREKEANSFAANLLVPRCMLNDVWTRFPVEQLSKLFAVSVPVIKNRISFEYGA
ncbi:ImmA/IrrE family metallo-endopeptidase [Rubrivivax sp. JA1024]|nr:ImmA/IrrE family metallo-endopeptidase [Rubrivivax sp. JA1024]